MMEPPVKAQCRKRCALRARTFNDLSRLMQGPPDVNGSKKQQSEIAEAAGRTVVPVVNPSVFAKLAAAARAELSPGRSDR